MRNITPLAVRQYTGGKITAPGIYDRVPIDLYHGDICDGPSISSGGLRTIETRSARHYYVGSPYCENPPVQAEKEAWVFGRAVHTLLLGEKGFREQFRIRPTTYPDDDSKPWNGNAKVCREWLAQAKLDGFSVLKPDSIEHIKGMADALAAHPTIQTGILNGLVEKSIFWTREFNGQKIWLKSRPDNIPLESNMGVDLKTCDSADPVQVRASLGSYGYHQQLALAAEGIYATTGRRITDFVLVFIEKAPPYAINIKPVSAAAIEYGHRQNLRAMQIFAEAVRTGYWPAYDDDDEVPAELPDWLSRRLAFEAENKLLPEYQEPPAPGITHEPETEAEGV